jgi:hypothetical protein
VDRWTGEGTSNMTPRVTTGATANNVFSDYFGDASYVRIQNVQLGYSLNSRYTKRYYQVKIVCRSKQPVHFTKYKGFDPGASNPIGGGIDYGFISYSKNLFVRSKH